MDAKYETHASSSPLVQLQIVEKVEKSNQLLLTCECKILTDCSLDIVQF